MFLLLSDWIAVVLISVVTIYFICVWWRHPESWRGRLQWLESEQGDAADGRGVGGAGGGGGYNRSRRLHHGGARHVQETPVAATPGQGADIIPRAFLCRPSHQRPGRRRGKDLTRYEVHINQRKLHFNDSKWRSHVTYGLIILSEKFAGVWRD